MSSKIWFRRASAAMASIGLAVALVPLGAGPGTPAFAQAATCDPNGAGGLDPAQLRAGGEFHAVTPDRIYDSRKALGGPQGPRSTVSSPSNLSQTFDVPVLGLADVPASADEVLAVVLNVTVTQPSARGNLVMYPKGFDTNNGANASSVVNFQPGLTVPNLVVVSPGDQGRVTGNLVTSGVNGTAHVVVDVFGWISTSQYADVEDDGGRFIGVTPGRILNIDSVGEAASVRLPILGARTVMGGDREMVPNDPGITAVMVNITVDNRLAGSKQTNVAALPTAPGGTPPATSNTNVPPGRAKANLAIVELGSDGAIHLYNRWGNARIIVDVLGYFETGFAPTTRAGRIIPLEAPFRAFDTRKPEHGAVPLNSGSYERWSFNAFAGSVTLQGQCVGRQSALIGNLTGTGLVHPGPGYVGSPQSFIAMGPASGASSPTTAPSTSSLNLIDGESVPNAVVLNYGNDGSADQYIVQAYNRYGYVHYLLDVFAIVLAD